MADPMHAALARGGPHAIARWREQVYWRRRSIDLSGAFLSGARMGGADLAHDNLSQIDLTNSDLRLADLSGANLQGAHLWRSDLSGADLRRANLKEASLVRCNIQGGSLQNADMAGTDLSHANLRCANLSNANLQGANLTETNLAWADMGGADLRNCRITAANLEVTHLAGADLRGASLVRPRLTGASFEDCLFEMTLLADCDLSEARGLSSARHSGPSIIGADSLARSKGLIPEDFLRQAGVAAPFIDAQRELLQAGRGAPRALLICSKSDAGLTARIQADLRQAGIQSWILAADDEEVLTSDQGALQRVVYYDLLVLICSGQSLGNPHTSRLFAHLEPGGETGRNARTIAAATDDLLFQSRDQLCVKLRETCVVDLRGWERKDSYQAGLARLAAALTATS